MKRNFKFFSDSFFLAFSWYNKPATYPITRRREIPAWNVYIHFLLLAFYAHDTIHWAQGLIIFFSLLLRGILSRFPLFFFCFFEKSMQRREGEVECEKELEREARARESSTAGLAPLCVCSSSYERESKSKPERMRGKTPNGRQVSEAFRKKAHCINNEQTWMAKRKKREAKNYFLSLSLFLLRVLPYFYLLFLRCGFIHKCTKREWWWCLLNVRNFLFFQIFLLWEKYPLRNARVWSSQKVFPLSLLSLFNDIK